MHFKVPLQLAPVMLGFKIFIPGSGSNGSSAGQYLTPAGGRHFTLPVGLQPGYPIPQGLSKLQLLSVHWHDKHHSASVMHKTSTHRPCVVVWETSRIVL